MRLIDSEVFVERSRAENPYGFNGSLLHVLDNADLIPMLDEDGNIAAFRATEMEHTPTEALFALAESQAVKPGSWMRFLTSDSVMFTARFRGEKVVVLECDDTQPAENTV